jgi:hypothetical protein
MGAIDNTGVKERTRKRLRKKPRIARPGVGSYSVMSDLMVHGPSESSGKGENWKATKK